MSPGDLLIRETGWFLWAVAATLAYRMLTGRIRSSGLLADKATGLPVSPERVQLLMATLLLSLEYIGQVARNTTTKMPEISASWLTVFGLSSGVYAATKTVRLWRAGRVLS